MRNQAIAQIFADIADLLEIRGEQPFRISAYRRAGRVLGDLAEDVADLLAAGKLADLPGIGKGSIAKIEEYLADGAISFQAELLESTPPGLPALLKIPGLGPKRVALAWK